MARIPGAPRNQGGPLRRLFVGIVYSLTQRRLGRLIMPVQVTALTPTSFGDTSRWSNRKPVAS